MALWRIRATVDDRPGYLSVLTASLALRGVNILTVQVHTTEVGAVDDFLVDAPDQLTEADLLAAIERGRGRDCWVARSEARGLADQPTRVLGLANRLVRDPDGAGEALRALLGADTVTWRPVPVGARPGIGAATMLLADPAGGSFELRRAAPSFTPAEYARAQALVELAGTAARRASEQVTLLLPDGAELLVRPATGDDLPGVVELHAACSARSRQRRYLGGAACPPAPRLRRLLEPARGSASSRRRAAPAGRRSRSSRWRTCSRRGTRPRWRCWCGTTGSGVASARRCYAAWSGTPSGPGTRPWCCTSTPRTRRCCGPWPGWAARPRWSGTGRC